MSDHQSLSRMLELALPLIGVLLLLACLAFCARLVMRRCKPHWYWLTLLLLLCGGTLTSLLSSEFSDGPEMPAGFVLGIRLAAIGMVLTCASAISLGAKRILARREATGNIPE
jgi:uncharacterized membrane-anchored protein